MQQGNFFKLDENSKLNQGQVIFRYLPVTDKNKTYFPIYAALKPYSIDFYYHSIDERLDKNDEEDKSKNEQHINIRILHLPLSSNLSVKDNLSEILKSNFDCAYPLGKQYSIELKSNDQYYWNLTEYCPKGEYQKIIKKHFPDKEQDISKYVYFRKLILDFLYDLEHSHIFENSPHYEEIEVRLKANFFFNAIASKVAYYHNRRLYTKNKNDRDVKDLYSHKLKPSEAQWLKILRIKQSCQIFWKSGGWFEKVEDEYEKVLFSKKDRFDRFKWQHKLAKKDEDNILESAEIIKDSIRWFLRRYNFSNAFKTLLCSKDKGIPFLFAIIFLCLFLFPVIVNSEFSENITDKNISFIVYFFIGSIVGLILFTSRYWRFLQSIVGLIMPRMIMAISSAWLIFVITEELLKVSFDIPLFEHKYKLIILLVPVILFMAMEIRNLAKDISTWKIIKRVTIILIISFFYSILTGLFFTNLSTKRMLCRSGYLETFYRNNISKSKMFQSDSVFAYGVGSLDANGEILKDFKNDSLKYQDPTSIELKLVYYKKNWNNCKSKPDSLIKKMIRESCSERLFDCLTDIDLHNLKFKILYKIPFPFNKNLLILVFPGMLFFRAIFALFIGIFIQLIFEEKAITEPL